MGQINARNHFFEEIGKKMESNDVYIVSADLAGPPFDYIRKEFPKRYIAVGIAEQNMVSVACGLALSGKNAIAYTSNPFISLRAYDQVRNAAALMNLPLTIVGVGTGFSISAYGTTHFVTEDFAMMSLCPGIKTITVTDVDIADGALQYVLSPSHQPCYLRFDKDCNDSMGGGKVDLQKGWRILKEGEDVAVICQGYLAQVAHKVSLDAGMPAVIDVFAYPFDESSLARELLRYKKIIVMEEQQRRGGLGSIILEMLNDCNISLPVKRMGVDFADGFPEVYGSREYWLNHYGIDAAHLAEEIKG